MVKKRKSMELNTMESPMRAMTVSHKKAKQKQSAGRNHVEDLSDIIRRAEKFRLSLGIGFPSFVKFLTHSHVCSKICFYAPFCRLYMVGAESAVTLVNESGREFKVCYNAKRFELYWRRFSLANELCAGDVAVFQLIENLKFKVYIMREKDVSEINDPSDTFALPACIIKTEASERKMTDSVKLEITDFESDSSLGSSQSENDSEGSYDSDSEDSSEMVISGYSKKFERKNRKRLKFLLGSDIIERAKKVKAGHLSANIPSCIRRYSQSCHDRHYMRLPRKFCAYNLKGDGAVKDVVLVSEDDGKDYDMKFFQDWKELNCGWSAFSKCNNLCIGDVLVFCLIGHFKFKVHIVREKSSVKSEEPICAVSNPHSSKNVNEEGVGSSEILKTPRFEDFSIVINNMPLDSKIPKECRKKYLNLCCAQNSYLHQHILEHVDTIGWSVDIISKIVAISDDIRSCRLSSPPSFFQTRISILQSFEKLGMNVKFLQDRLSCLKNMSLEPEATKTQEDAGRELFGIEMEMLKLKKRREELVFEIEEKKIISQGHERKFMEMTKASW